MNTLEELLPAAEVKKVHRLLDDAVSGKRGEFCDPNTGGSEEIDWDAVLKTFNSIQDSGIYEEIYGEKNHEN